MVETTFVFMVVQNVFILFIFLIVFAAIVFGSIYMLSIKIITEFRTHRTQQIKISSKSQLLNLRLKAFERLVLFVERISPDQLIMRHTKQRESATELKHRLVKNIQDEYYHNITQQLYISPILWSEIVAVKEGVIQLVEKTYNSIPEQGSGTDLGKQILFNAIQNEDNQIVRTLQQLKSELEQYF